MNEIKKPNWEECTSLPILIQKHPSDHPLDPHSPAEVGMHVFGKLNGEDINLVVTKVLIKDQGDNDEYETTVFGYFPKANLENGDPLWIDRKHICHMSSDK